MQEAQSAHASAEERLRRAQARLQKRVARVERIEGRLAHYRQQTREPAITDGASSEPQAIPQEGAAEQNAVNVVQEGDVNEQQEESTIGQQLVQEEAASGEQVVQEVDQSATSAVLPSPEPPISQTESAVETPAEPEESMPEPSRSRKQRA